MESDLNGKILGVFDQANTLLGNIKVMDQPFAVVDIAIVAILFYIIYLFLRQTRALGIIYGIFVLAIFWLLGQALQLTLLNTLLRWLFTSILVAIPVVFQPELRSALERLGRSTKIVTELHRLTKSDLDIIIDEIIDALVILSKNKYGALIVVGKTSGLQEYILTGTIINAEINSKLLVNLFTPKAPLHDGAVIIVGNKIVAASTTLPILDSLIDLSLGTRHKAALSISKETDAIALVVSEETGAISIARNGKMQKNLRLSELKENLTKYINANRLSLRKT